MNEHDDIKIRRPAATTRQETQFLIKTFPLQTYTVKKHDFERFFVWFYCNNIHCCYFSPVMNSNGWYFVLIIIQNSTAIWESSKPISITIYFNAPRLHKHPHYFDQSNCPLSHYTPNILYDCFNFQIWMKNKKNEENYI